jgi:glycosyltransferase involved in cell wall biosynthesis
MDLAHPTYYSLLSSKIFKAFDCPVVLTVYDMIHERFPRLVDRRGRNAAMKRAAIQAADAIICISQSTKQDLLEYYAIPEDRISVIHLAACLASRGESAQGPAKTDSFFLYVGSRAAYKNFDLLLDAMNALIATRLDCRLYVVGPPFNERERTAISRLGLTRHIVHRGVVSDDELTSLYRASTALVYPSRYEGFGIPLLEAMQCKTAIVAADTSSIPEVVGDAALLFDPDSSEQLAMQLRDLLTLPELRETMIRKGLMRSEQFSWQATAAATLDVYRAAFAGRPSGAINHIVGCEKRRKGSVSPEAA